MLNALPEAERKQAILNFSKTGNNNLTEAFKDNVAINYAGLRTNDLPGPGRQRFRDLIHLDEGHARVKMDEVDRYLDQTWFTWIGGTQPDSAFYYRVHSPVVLIEFDHQQPANPLKFAADPTKPTQQHIHRVVRTPKWIMHDEQAPLLDEADNGDLAVDSLSASFKNSSAQGGATSSDSQQTAPGEFSDLAPIS